MRRQMKICYVESWSKELCVVPRYVMMYQQIKLKRRGRILLRREREREYKSERFITEASHMSL